MKEILEFGQQETQRMLARWAFITGLQKTWIVNYLHGATGEEPCFGRVGATNCYGVNRCQQTQNVVIAVEKEELSRDFDARALLEWALGTGHKLTLEGLTAWEGLNRTKQANAEPGRRGTAAGLAAEHRKRGPKTRYFLRRHCVKACMKRGLEQSGIEAAVQEFCENHFFEYDGAQMLVIPDELNGITGNVIKHDLAWLRTKGNSLPKLQGDNKAVIRAFEKWLEKRTP